MRLRGQDGGRYLFNYVEMLDTIFGKEKNTIEVCSGSIKGDCFTADIRSDTRPDLVTDGQELYEIPNGKFCRWRCDPPYNSNTAEKMYSTVLPKTGSY